MTITGIFIVQLLLSLIVFSLVASWYVAPWLARLSTTTALTVLVLPHTLRHVGLSFLVPNLNNDGLPETFASGASYGDLLSALLALAALFALRLRSLLAIPMVWLLNIVGTIDLGNALRQAEAIEHFGATWFIPTFFVPILLISHWMIFARLISNKPQQAAAA